MQVSVHKDIRGEDIIIGDPVVYRQGKDLDFGIAVRDAVKTVIVLPLNLYHKRWGKETTAISPRDIVSISWDSLKPKTVSELRARERDYLDALSAGKSP